MCHESICYFVKINANEILFMLLHPRLHPVPQFQGPGRIVQSVMCLTTDQGVASSIPARSHTSVEIDHEISSTAILIHEGLLQAKVCAQIPD